MLLSALPAAQFLLVAAHAGQDLASAHEAVHHALGVPAHRFHRGRERADYLGVFLASIFSWVAVPGPGEAALIAAGISARHGHLDLTTVIAAAFLGSTLGGMAGWQVGRRGGRALLTAPGLLLRLRLSMVKKGDHFYERYGPVAVLFTPSWMAGIHNMRWSRFLLANTLSALVWAAGIGVGADLLGPSIADIQGTAGVFILIAIALVALALFLMRRGKHPA